MEVVMDDPEADPIARSLLGEKGIALWDEVRRFWYGPNGGPGSPGASPRG
jgi:hypothetical protein